MGSIKLFSVIFIVFFLGVNSHLATKTESREKQLSTEKQTPTTRYEVRGDRQGKVTVIDTASGKVIRTFGMDAGVAVRERFILDGGKTIAASQKDHTVFWDLATGREIGRVNERVRGFSSSKNKLISQNKEGIFLYAYPQLSQICKLTNHTEAGIIYFLFSPDSRFLYVQFHTVIPPVETSYPSHNAADSGVIYNKIFNLRTCQEIEEFSVLDIHVKSLKFSSDSNILYATGSLFTMQEGRLKEGAWQFDLINYNFQEISK